MKHVYSFGIDSPLKIKITEDQAAAYNRTISAYFTAQKLFKIINGRRWTPNDPLFINTSGDTKKDLTTYNRIGRLLTKTIKNFGRPILEEELPSDYLVRN